MIPSRSRSKNPLISSIKSNQNDNKKMSTPNETILNKMDYNNTKLSPMISRSLGNLLEKVQKDDNNTKQRKKKQQQSIQRNNSNTVQSKNELSKLIPGYVAPLRLIPTTSNTTSTTTNISLEQLRRKALTEEAVKWNIPMVPSNNNSNKLINTTGSGSFVTAVTSIKTGHKKIKRSDNIPPQDAGSGWFNMKPSIMTDDIKRDILLIKNRQYLDPKHFYKSSDTISNIIQVGTVIEGSTEYYSSRLTNKQRKSNLTDEIMSDNRLRNYAINKYKDISRQKQLESDSRNRRKRKKK